MTRRLLTAAIAAALLLPSFVHAQCPSSLVVSESWQAYCDNGVARVRMTLRVAALPNEIPTLPSTTETDIAAIDADDTSGLWVSSTFDRIETIGPGAFEFIEEWWPLSQFPSRMVRRMGIVRWYCAEGTFPGILLNDTDGPFAIPDVTCPPLPVASSTWGAIKALYRRP